MLPQWRRNRACCICNSIKIVNWGKVEMQDLYMSPPCSYERSQIPITEIRPFSVLDEGTSHSQRLVSNGFNWGEEKEVERRKGKGIKDIGKLPSGAGVCQQQAALVHSALQASVVQPEQDLHTMGKQTKPIWQTHRGKGCVCNALSIHAEDKWIFSSFLWISSKDLRHFVTSNFVRCCT